MVVNLSNLNKLLSEYPKAAFHKGFIKILIKSGIIIKEIRISSKGELLRKESTLTSSPGFLITYAALNRVTNEPEVNLDKLEEIREILSEYFDIEILENFYYSDIKGTWILIAK